jgi:S1-C subfamily serine protease
MSFDVPWERRLAPSCLAATILLTSVGCGGSPPRAPAAPAPAPVAVAPPAPAEVHERIVPHTCRTRAKIDELLGRSMPAPPPPADENAQAAPPPPAMPNGAGATVGTDIYREVAPATVLVRNHNGFGTGVVVDPKGYVLTNNHVVAEGDKKDFVLHVDVIFGEMTPTGRMTQKPKTYDGVVVKVDPVRDLALVRVMDPPAKMPVVKLAKSAPQIGEKVLSIGNAGIGFLWAAKSCHVAGVGTHQEDVSMVAGIDCSHADPSLTAERVQEAKKSCEERKKAMVERFAVDTQGLAVQTDCAITHGDSGGPLVDSAGELVGLNQSISIDAATAAFHVHVDEIRDFLAKHGEEGIAVLPDPLCAGGLDPSLEDLDLDGVPETLVMQSGSWMYGYGHRAVLIDLDQDHFSKPRPALGDFEAEIAMVGEGRANYIYYDANNDKRWDLLLVDDTNDGTPDHAYRILADGRVEEDRNLLPQHDLDVSLVKDASLHVRLGRIASVIGSARAASPEAIAAASRVEALPDPLLGAGSKGRLTDTDSNGKPDTVFVKSAFAHGFLLDPSEKSIGALKVEDAADDVLKAKKVDAEVSLVVQGNSAWAFYDVDHDSKLDLALVSENASEDALYATRAWRVGADGALSPAPEHIGRALLRPGLIASPRALDSLRYAHSAFSYNYAADEGAGTLPNPREARGHTMFGDVKGFPKGTVIYSSSGAWTTRWFDLNAKPLPAKAPPPAKKPGAGTSSSSAGTLTDTALASGIAADPKFRPQVALVNRGDWTWAYYDTDGDGQFDLALFSPKSGQDPVQAFRLKADKEGGAVKLERDASAVQGRLIRHSSVFKDKVLAAKWKKLASEIFRASSIED